MFLRCKMLIALMFFGLGAANAAFVPEGAKQLSAVLADGRSVVIGDVTFSKDKGGNTVFALHLDHSQFTDFFLSMREFKCLPSDKEVACHVPYPYVSPFNVSDDKYTWLSHRLLFLFKRPAEFGAKLWNGIYFDFKVRGDALVGYPQAVDLNEIGAPPEDLSIPPYQEINRHDMNPDERWIRELRLQ